MAQPHKKVTILGIEDGGESSTLRAAAEEMFLCAELVRIGEPKDITQLLHEGLDTDLLIFSCHGFENTIIMPDLAEDIAKLQPFSGNMSPRDVRDHLELEGVRVLNTACSSGRKEMAAAFLDAGCEWYVAPTEDWDGRASFVFTINLIYQHLACGVDVDKALEKSINPDDESRFISLYKPTIL